ALNGFGDHSYQPRAVSIFEALVAERPAEARYRYDLAAALLGSQIFRRDGHLRARTLLEEVVRAEPGAPEYKAQLARCYHGLASRPADSAQGRADLERARDLLEDLVKAGTASQDDTTMLATISEALGATEADAGRLDEAIGWYRRAQDVREGLA